ncbi:MAG: hypothetical protein GY835_12270 [bacterium]|nr:hypothetical protein [bacterium]
MNRSTRKQTFVRAARAVAIVALLGFSTVASAADTQLNGYWEGNLGGNRQSDDNTWDIWHGGQYYELKLLSRQGDNAEAWIKFGGRWDGNNNKFTNPRLFAQEGHLKYRLDRDGKGFESFLFFREQRYWIGNHLLNLVDEGNVSNGNNSQGVRFDAWHGAWNLTYVLSDASEQTMKDPQADDFHIVRLTRRYGDQGSYFGGSILRKVDKDPDNDFNQVRSFDWQWITNPVDISVEVAHSEVPSETDVFNDTNDPGAWRHGSLRRSFEAFLPTDAAVRGELRNITMGDHRWGHYTINAGYWNIGSNYRNFLGGDTTDRIGHFFNTYYRMPQRAITYSLKWGKERKSTSYTYDLDEDDNPILTNDPKSWLEQNIYLEFINGFKVALTHNRRDEMFLGRDYRHYDWLAELIVENRLAWLKTQFKIKDWDTQHEKRIFGMETTLNIGGPWKWYNRFMVASDAARSRYMLYTQLQYRPHDNMEMFLSYGPDYYGDWGELTNDGDFESGGRMRDEYKLMIKTWF